VSSYVTSFENQQFHTNWNKIKEKIENIDIDSTSVVFQEDFARFVKVFNFIDNLFENIDPELIPKNLLDDLKNKASSCLSQINTALASNNQNNLNTANANLDQILTSLRPYSLYNDKLERSLRAAIKAYIDEIDAHLENIPNTQEEYDKAVELREKIESYYDELFKGDEESDAIKNQISSILTSINEQFDEIDSFHTKLLIDEEEESLSTQIENAKKSINEDTEEAKELLTETSSKVQELKEFYFKIFGTPNEETGVLEGGLRQELDTRLKELDEYKSNQTKAFETLISDKAKALEEYEATQKERIENLYKKIEEHLPGATSAGLAKAYEKRRKFYQIPIFTWNVVFVIAMLIMIYFGYKNLQDVKNWEDALKHILHYTPIYLPAIWLAIYASKRRSESRALEEEYAHKEALAKSYSSYKLQIEEIGGDDKGLIEKLLDKTIDTVSDNPSKVLDRKHGDNSPVMDLAEKVADNVVSKIPTGK
jgi:hypothetical protein